MAQEIIVADIGGTHARFAIAKTEQGKVVRLVQKLTLNCADYSDLKDAWADYGTMIQQDMPTDGSIALAAHIGADILEMTNNHWMIKAHHIREELGLDRLRLINDFGAVGHAVARAEEQHFSHLCGPETSIVDKQTLTVVGPGTGLGVAHVVKTNGSCHVSSTEGSHIAFAPHDEFEDRLLASLRKNHGRVSVERIVSGPGLREIYRLVAETEGGSARRLDDTSLWQLALAGNDRLAMVAFDRFCSCLGSFAGDMALAHGADAVAISGGLGSRIAKHVPSSGFAERFVAKGRFSELMEQIPVWHLNMEEPGLIGSAAAFLQEYGVRKA
ncbi:MAG: glucokinase [Pseudomonadota bacterium]